jgi:hypothetical protein
VTSGKIKLHHLARKAVLYVRQSSAHQVVHNRESRALQYAMRDRLVTLGWSEIETVDDDLGRSAAGGIAREGFERMVAEVCLGKVGAVAAREVSRFARNCDDERHSVGHQTTDEVNVSPQAAEFRDNYRGLQFLRMGKRCSELAALARAVARLVEQPTRSSFRSSSTATSIAPGARRVEPTLRLPRYC